MKKILFLVIILVSNYISVSAQQVQTGPDYASLKGLRAENSPSFPDQTPGEGFILSSPVTFNSEGFALNNPEIISVMVRFIDTAGYWVAKSIPVKMINQVSSLDYFRYISYPYRISVYQVADRKQQQLIYQGMYN